MVCGATRPLSAQPRAARAGGTAGAGAEERLCGSPPLGSDAVCPGGVGSANRIATFIAGTVPIYEYADDPSQRPRLLIKSNSDGLFRHGGRELHYLDGRPAKRHLAISADDVNCVVATLNDPERAHSVRRLRSKSASKTCLQSARIAVSMPNAARDIPGTGLKL